MLSQRENILRAIHFEEPEYVPVNFCINSSCYNAYPQEELFDLMESHPFLFPDFKRPKIPYTPNYGLCSRKDQPFTDDWGCLWQTTTDGIVGTVTRHPLDDWAKLNGYTCPDPERCMGIGPVDWERERELIMQMKKDGNFVQRGLRHGHTFLQICDIRGYQNVLFDMMDEEPKLVELLEKITDFNSYIIKKYLDMDVDVISYAEDLGMQQGPMLTPDHLRQYILPCYKRLMQPAKEKGTAIHMHSDGDIRLLAPILLECGVDILNLQDLVNGIDWIRDNLKGRVCIDLDIDRQKVTVFGTKKDIDELVLNEIRELGSRKGGLMLTFGLYPGTPLENVKALMGALEKYAFYYA